MSTIRRAISALRGLYGWYPKASRRDVFDVGYALGHAAALEGRPNHPRPSVWPTA